MLSIDFENETVAFFEGRKRTLVNGETWWSDPEGQDQFQWQTSDLRYWCDWNWLMKIVEKIEGLGENSTTRYNVGIEINSCFITKWDDGEKDESFTISHEDAESKIDAVFQCVVEFINWYNSKKIT